MESAGTFLGVLTSNSLWLAGSGFVLWLGLRSRLQLSPSTRAAASLLVVLQGWIWIGIPVELGSAWIPPEPAVRAAHQATPPEERAALALAPLPASLPLPFDSRLNVAASSLPNVKRLAGAAIAALWLAGIAGVLGRSIRGYVALSRVVQALPAAPVAWQRELSALCRQQAIGRPLVLKISQVAAPMLVQTWGPACIVFPAWLWESCTADQRTSILRHELAHYRRGDLWRQLVMRLLALPHWFNPVAWWAVRQFEAASEAACDEAACGGDPHQALSYSKALLALSELAQNDRPVIRYDQALAISGGSLSERIRRVLHPEFRKESQMSRVLMLSAMVMLTGLATIRIQAGGQSPPPESEAPEKKSSEAKSGEHELAKVEPIKPPVVSLLQNGGFEETRDDSDAPESWGPAFLTRTARHFLMGASPRGARSGQRSVFITIGENHPDLQVAYSWTSVVQGWKAGETYELSGWIKVENAERPAFIMAQFWSAEGKEGKMIGGATTQWDFPVKGTTDWTRVSTRLTVPEGTGVLRIRAGLSSQKNQGANAWFDDLSLVPVASLDTPVAH